MNFSQKITRVPIVASDTTVYDPPLVGLEVFTTGDVAVIEAYTGAAITRTFPTAANGGAYPIVWEIQIRQVLAAGTTVLDANLLGFRE